MRTRYQYGTVIRECRKLGPDVWVYRYFENGRRKKVPLGTVEQYRNKAEAMKAAEGLRLLANPDHPAARPVTFSALIDRYQAEELPERKSTRTFYKPWIENHIRPKWGDYLLVNVKPFAVEQWLNKLPLAPKSKAHIRSLMRIMVDCAMRWELLKVQQNPIGLVRVKGSTKRRRQPRVLTAAECNEIAVRVPEPFRTMLWVAMGLGLRVSEILGLQWGDVDWVRLEVRVQRAVVLAVEDQVKTVYSERTVPLDPALAEILFTYRRIYSEQGGDGEWVFHNPDTGRPWRPSYLQQRYLRQTGLAAGLGEGIGWHTFRHSYSSMLRQLGTDIKVQQELLRHADVRTTLNVYTQAVPEHVRQANSSVMRLLEEGKRVN